MAAVEEEKKARQSRLQLAIANDDVDELHNLIVEERELLDRVSKQPFPNTPLHIAAAAGKTKVAMEMAILKPSFAWELNPEGYSPMHLALQHEQYHTVRALMTLDPKLIRVRGRGGITPLHFVARGKGDNEQENKELLELLAEFLCACKSSIEDLTSQCETAIHVAVKNHNLKAFKILLGWLKRVHMIEIVYWKDQDDHTVYDIVASIVPQLEQQNLEQNLEQLEINLLHCITKEDAKEEALEFFRNLANLFRRGRAKKYVKLSLLSELLSKELTAFEKFTFWLGRLGESARNIILTVSTLIATATYQAALSPPGGYWEDNSSKPAANSIVVTASSSGIASEKSHNAGNIILSGSKLYLFTALNSLVFLVSIGAILITAISLLPRSLAVFLLMWLLGISYYITAVIEFPKFEMVGANLIVGIYLSLQAVVFLVPLILCMSYYNFRLRIKATGRRVGDFLEWKDQK